MADATPDAASGYVDAVKWIVGLSGAVFAGVFLHPEQMTHRSEGMRIYLAVMLFLLGISMIGGVVYLLWLNRIRNMKELAKERKTSLALPVVAAGPQTGVAAGKGKVDESDRLRKSQKNMNRWYLVLSIPFYLGASMGVLAFCFLIALPVKEAEAAKPVVPLRFTMMQSAVHKTKNGMQAHTFLVNQQSGEVWQMICDPQGDAIALKRVKRLDVNGGMEKIEAVTP